MSVPSRRRRTYLAAPDRRAQILDVAKRVFARRGYHVANVADICQAARIGRGTLYQYFDNKRDVLLAVLEELATRVEKHVAARTRVADLPGLGRVPLDLVVSFCKRRLRDVLDVIFADEASIRLVLRDARGLDGAFDRVIARIDEAVLAAMVADTEAAQRAGVIRAGDARLYAQFVLGGIEKMVLSALAVDRPVDLATLVDAAVEAQLFGLLSEEVRR